MATGALASIICLLLITGSKALTFPNFSGNPAFPSFPSGTGAAPGDTVAPASPPAAPPSIAIGALTQPSSPPVGIGTGMNLNAVTKNVNFFKNLTDGFSEINFNYAEDGTANAFSERACMDDCVQNPDCVMVLWCEKAAEAPTSLGVMPGSLGGISVGPRSNFECKIFKESATGAQQSETSETTSQWTSKCKYLQINPVCKNITPKTGWMTVGKATVSTDHTLSQIYDCSSGYRKETNINSITCDKTGVIEETGSCTLAMSVNPITETSAAGELPALGSAGPVGSAGSAGSVLSNLITQNLPSFSSRDVNECLDGNPCGDIPNSDCHNTQEGYECLCHEGFTKEVTQCVDIDECLDGSPCVDISNSDCVNTQGNYECQCHEGFAKVDNTCVDINECELENICPAGHDCNNIVGSYECKDVDECLTEDICSTGHVCTNTAGSYECSDVDECLTEDICSTGHVCTNTAGSYECSDVNECLIEDICSTGHVCTNTDGSYECSDVDECLTEDICSTGHVCTNTAGSYECSDVNECLIEDICSTGHVCTNTDGSYECSDVDECLTEDICSTGHVCTNTAGSYECSDVDECLTEDICSTGHLCTNTDGSYECSDVDECLTEDICSTGHVCTNTAGSYECSDVDECLTEDICSTGHVCTNTAGSYECSDVNECLTEDICSTGHVCTNTAGSYECSDVNECLTEDICSTGHVCTNTAGSYECSDVDECLTEDICSTGHVCTNTAGSYECNDVDECLTEDICSTGHLCTNTAGSYECSDVDECLTEDICSTGHLCTNTAGSYECSDVDECLTEDICSTGHVCTNTAGSYECNDVDECLTGDICSTGHVCTNTAGSYECSDIDECTDENSCGENSVCDNTEGGYVCHCLDGFTKVENECVALEPLPVTQPPTSSETEDSCPDNEYFKSETNGCECVAGYERLSYGSSCTDVNECEAESICPAGHVCTNIDGDYECRVSENPADICEARGFTYDAETNFCFKYLDDFKTQEKAKNTCEVDFDARLATVNTHGKVRAIEDYLKRPDTPWGFYMWIDGEQEYTVWMYDLYYYGYFFYYWYPVEGVAWSDSSLVASDLFQYDPNNNFAKCTEIDPLFYDYKFAEWECDYQQPFVCEIPVKNCPAPFQYDEDSHFCYKFENVVVYYEEQAWVECNKIGARLAVTNTQRKIDVVKAAADATTRNTNYDGSYFPIIVAAWFDTYDYFEGREVNTWYDGSHVRWDLFKTGQPNFIFGDCVAIDGNKLQDIYCYDMFEYVCEIPQ